MKGYGFSGFSSTVHLTVSGPPENGDTTSSAARFPRHFRNFAAGGFRPQKRKRDSPRPIGNLSGCFTHCDVTQQPYPSFPRSFLQRRVLPVLQKSKERVTSSRGGPFRLTNTNFTVDKKLFGVKNNHTEPANAIAQITIRMSVVGFKTQGVPILKN